MNEVHYSSKTVEWETPPAFFQKLDELFGFTLDVCASAANAKCARYFTAEQDGLQQVWEGVRWMNPPYGRGIGAWMEKAYRSALAGATVVCLIPSRTDTRWWHEYVMRGVVHFVRGRLKFNNSKVNAPFPCAVCVFQPGALT